MYKEKIKQKQSISSSFRRKMKRNPTRAESALKSLFDYYGIDYIFQKGWMAGLKTFYISDFYLPKIKTVIEVDGSSHLHEKQKLKDAQKDDYLKRIRGFKVVRVKLFGFNK